MTITYITESITRVSIVIAQLDHIYLNVVKHEAYSYADHTDRSLLTSHRRGLIGLGTK